MTDFKNVTVRGNRPRRRKNADMPRFRKIPDFFGGRADNAQNTTVRELDRKHLLLDATKRLCRSGIAGENHQRATAAEQFAHRLERVAVNRLETAGTVRRTRIVPQIQVIVLRERVAELLQNGQSAKAGIKDAYHTHLPSCCGHTGADHGEDPSNRRHALS